MSSSLETVPCEEFLPDVYRFALLMTGSEESAAEVLRRTVERATQGGVNDLRDTRRIKRSLFTEARQLCMDPVALRPLPPVPDAPTKAAVTTDSGANASTQNGTNGDASHTPVPPVERPVPVVINDAPAPVGTLTVAFAALPERERSALILFYLYLFNPAELAEVLELRADTLGPVLAHARALLTREIEKAPLGQDSDARPDSGEPSVPE